MRLKAHINRMNKLLSQNKSIGRELNLFFRNESRLTLWAQILSGRGFVFSGGNEDDNREMWEQVRTGVNDEQLLFVLLDHRGGKALFERSDEGVRL